MKKSISIIGGGPASLSLASFLDAEHFDVTIYEKNKTVGRKFLVAGKGGFNLTHSEPIEEMIKRFCPVDFLEESLINFTNEDLRVWFEKIGIPTIIGSSKRIYPEEEVKPIDVLNAITNHLSNRGVKIEQEHTWTGWNRRKDLVFNKTIPVKSDIVVFALGGGSWGVTGSDGVWLETFQEQGIECTPFEASNCGFKLEWSEEMRKRFEGDPLKNIALTCQNKTQKGEVVLTKFGLEGGAIYALSGQIRGELSKKGKATLTIDLKPMLEEDEVLKKLEKSTHKNTTDTLRVDLKLSAVQLAIVKQYVSKEDFVNSSLLASRLKNIELEVLGLAPIEDAISTVGGVNVAEVDEKFELKKMTNHFCIGEMLDWDAPTGGYLLQACFSMGVKLASHLNEDASP